MAEDEEATEHSNNEQKTVRTRKVYLKDVSFETPNSPAIFTRDWKPQLGVEIDNSATTIGEDIYEVVLTVTATVSVEESTAFLAEVHQAGIFTLKGFTTEELQHAQNVFCMGTLYPYASAEVSDLVSKGGFPQLVLQPMNFQAVYAQRLRDAPENTGNSAE